VAYLERHLPTLAGLQTADPGVVYRHPGRARIPPPTARSPRSRSRS